MTNLQLWLGVAIPSVLVILSWMQANSRLSDLKESLTYYLNVRFQQVDQRFQQVDQRLDRIDSHLDGLEARVGRIETDYREFYGMEKKLEGRVDELSRRA